MAVDDLWYLKARDLVTNERRPSKRHGRGLRWRVRWVDPNTGETRTESFERKADADKQDALTRSEISQGRYIDTQAGRVTVAEYAERWRLQQLHRDSTSALVERAVRLHIAPGLGHWAMADVRAGHVRSWVKAVADDLQPSTVHLVYGYLKTMFAAAVADRIIVHNPCMGVRLPGVPKREYYVPDACQVHALAKHIAPQYSPIPYIAAGCGLRGGEIFGLELRNVDFLKREIRVEQQLKRMPGEPPYIGELKSSASIRTVELPDTVLQALAIHLKTHPAKEITIQDRTNPRGE